MLNLVKRVDDFVYASQLMGWASQGLDLPVEVLGFLPEDDHVAAAAPGQPALDLDSRAPFCQDVARLGQSIGQWAGRCADWALARGHDGSFERVATEYVGLFLLPGTALPTGEELLRRLKALKTA